LKVKQKIILEAILEVKTQRQVAREMKISGITVYMMSILCYIANVI